MSLIGLSVFNSSECITLKLGNIMRRSTLSMPSGVKDHSAKLNLARFDYNYANDWNISAGA